MNHPFPAQARKARKLAEERRRADEERAETTAATTPLRSPGGSQPLSPEDSFANRSSKSGSSVSESGHLVASNSNSDYFGTPDKSDKSDDKSESANSWAL